MLTGTLTELFIAAVLFSGGHFLLSSTPLRPILVARLGENAFRGGYSLLMVIFLGWMIASYGRAPTQSLFVPPLWTHWLALLLMLPATILFVGSLSPANPTSVTGDPAAVSEPRLGLYAVTRHPMMWGFALWGVAHLISNGDTAAWILFGSITVLAFFGTFAIDAKIRARRPEAWQRLSAITSNFPLAATLQGHNRLHGSMEVWLRVVLGVGLYGALLWLHPMLFGASPLP